ncbi:N-alpha-acetyltransferase 40 [Zootermopsis nevadensis]|uniref:N-alpha-acetyltransferase 40 n=1 Tax=Zootermopsis nevadensis TaxID=136037 RepID=A0A067RJN6_ZOONE|nr:N-alpha-acetyltransferase 40 [Zootermopsis nevadensis]KDR24066.1 N-acetyltransferase 11 [Zootermopsis nevadensis]
MERKSKRNKEKRQKRKEENACQPTSEIVLYKANNQDDPMAHFSEFRIFEKNGINVKLECKRCGSLDVGTIHWIFDLEKRNMKALYEQCEWGWNDKIKKEEMTDDKAWYLIARTTEPECKPVAFSHFRFDMDYGDEVLYCYELQLEEEVRRKGLGKFMLQVLELIGFSAGMKKVILTVLKHNAEAKAFYTALKYTIDETSPEDNVLEQYSYEILSKVNKKLSSSSKVLI